VFYLLVPVLAIIGIPIYDVRGTELSSTSDDSLFSFIIGTVVAWYCVFECLMLLVSQQKQYLVCEILLN